LHAIAGEFGIVVDSVGEGLIAMAVTDCPKLRHLRGHELSHEGQPYVVLDCPFGLFPKSIVIERAWFFLVVRYLDGKHTLVDIQAHVLRETGQLIPLENLSEFVDRLDQALALESPFFHEFVKGYRAERVRPASHAGRSYPSNDRVLRAQLSHYFTQPGGPGLPVQNVAKTNTLKAIVSPHIDFKRGGHVYSWAYRELVERSDAEIYVIIGVAHAPCHRRFAITRKDFETPLGRLRTDQTFVDHFVEQAGSGFFDDELAHRQEHSIEFQAVFLQYLLGEHRDFSIVPILVGSFHDLLEKRLDPMSDPEVSRFVRALTEAEKASGKRVVYIGGIDLCHVGPEFGDADPVDHAMSETIQQFDQTMLTHASANDPSAWFETAAQIDDRWRVCGLAATFTMLQVLGPVKGRILRYDQAIDSQRIGCVSFASLAYDSSVQS
jgi:hypothetical protein